MSTNSSKRKEPSSHNDNISEMSHKKQRNEPQNVLSVHAKPASQRLVSLCKETSMVLYNDSVGKICNENTQNG